MAPGRVCSWPALTLSGGRGLGASLSRECMRQGLPRPQSAATPLGHHAGVAGGEGSDRSPRSRAVTYKCLLFEPLSLCYFVMQPKLTETDSMSFTCQLCFPLSWSHLQTNCPLWSPSSSRPHTCCSPPWGAASSYSTSFPQRRQNIILSACLDHLPTPEARGEGQPGLNCCERKVSQMRTVKGERRGSGRNSAAHPVLGKDLKAQRA